MYQHLEKLLGFSVLMAELFGRENFHNFFQEVQNNPDTFLNLKNLKKVNIYLGLKLTLKIDWSEIDKE